MERPLVSLSDIHVFIKFAALRSITGAARALGMPKSSVSRSLVRLEQDLGAPLLLRSGTAISLTDHGTLFHQHAQLILQEVEAAERAMGQLRASPRGHLRVAAPVASGQHLIAPLLPQFMRQFPEVTVALELTSRRVDLLEENVDVLIRVGPLEDSRFVARKLGEYPLLLFGSPAYLQERGAPATVQDLRAHQLLDIFEGPHTWTLEGPEGQATLDVTPCLTVNDLTSVKTVVLQGSGLAWLPTFLCAREVKAERLVHLLPGWSRGTREVHAIFSSPRTASPKVRAFVDFLVARFGSGEILATLD